MHPHHVGGGRDSGRKPVSRLLSPSSSASTLSTSSSRYAHPAHPHTASTTTLHVDTRPQPEPLTPTPCVCTGKLDWRWAADSLSASSSSNNTNFLSTIQSVRPSRTPARCVNRHPFTQRPFAPRTAHACPVLLCSEMSGRRWAAAVCTCNLHARCF